MEMVKGKKTAIRPVKISDFLATHPAKEKATVRTGAWNVASTSGYDFSQWNGSESQKRAIERLFAMRAVFDERSKSKLSPQKKQQVDYARELILDAETSCYLFWGDAWIPKMYEKLNEVERLLQL